MKGVVLYYLVITALLIVTAVVVISCNKEDAKTVWYTVQFESNGGNEVAMQTVKDGGKLTDPGVQTRNGFFFGGWFTDDDDFNMQWNFTTDTVTADMTLYAKWDQVEKLKQNGYSITVWGGKNGTANITSVEPYITITATANSGYRFLEWQVLKDGVTVSSRTDNPAIIWMTSGAVIEWKAIFVPSVGLPYTVDIWKDNRGTIVRYKYDILNRYTEKSLILNNSGYMLMWGTYLNYEVNGNLVECYDLREKDAKFSQNGNKITFILNDHVCVSCFQTVKGEFELNAQELPVKLTYEEEYSEGFDVTVTWCTSAVVNFTWQNGNIIKTERKSENIIKKEYWYEEESKIIEESSSVSTITYTYDDKKTPFSQCNTPKWFFLWIDFFEQESVFYGNNKNYNKNNIKTETIEGGSAITYEYTYNDDGFPVIRSWEQERWNETNTYTETYTYY